MDFIKKNGKGLLFCLALAVPSAVLGKLFPVVGGPVFAILIGMILALVIKKRDSLESGVKYTSKKILQYAVVLLGFGLNLEVVMETGKQSLPIIVCTITTSLVISYILHRTMNIPEKISTLVGVGSSICGGSAIAATAAGVPTEVFQPLKELSKFFIIMAMGAIGFHTDVVKLIKGGGKPILMGMACWLGITVVTLSMQHLLNLW